MRVAPSPRHGGLIIAALAGSAWAAVPQITTIAEMRDGARLATDVYLPPGTGPWPAVVERTPYGRAGFSVLADEVLTAGRAYVTQDLRGRGESEGEDVAPFSDGWGTLQDGYDTIQWAAVQPWCTGRVMIRGGSIHAVASLLAAGAAPPSLEIAAANFGTGDLLEGFAFTGGVFRRSLVGGYVDSTGNPARIADFADHPFPGPHWDPVTLGNRLAEVDVPVVQVAGWFDPFADATIDCTVALDTRGGDGARGRQLLIIGPWVHGAIFFTEQGELTFPGNAVWTATAFDGLVESFNDATLLNVSGEVFETPTFQHYMMGDVDDPQAPGNEWRSSDAWPPPGQVLTLHLRGGGRLTSATPLSDETATTSSVSDPSDPVPTVGGRNLYISRGPQDQSSVEMRPDVVVFETIALEAPLVIAGPVSCELHVSSTAPDADFLVKLCDVYPDGRSILMMEGSIRVSRRLGLDRDDPLVLGEVSALPIDVGHIALALNAGHRLRISVASTNSPRLEVNPQTGAPFLLDDPVTAVATHTIHHAPDRLSRLHLHVQPMSEPILGHLLGTGTEVGGLDLNRDGLVDAADLVASLRVP